MMKIAIILGSTRPGRNGEAVAKWVYEVAKKRSDAEFELVDIQDCRFRCLRFRHARVQPWNLRRSKTRSIFCLPSGTTRPLALLATAAPAERARSSSCV